MKHDGYTIQTIKEQTFNHQGEKVSVTSYAVSIGDKVVETGLPNKDMAKLAIARRRKLRQRAGIDPVG